MKQVALRRLREFITPTDAELDALEKATKSRREFKRREVVSREGERVSEVYFLVDGWVSSSMVVNFDRRQLLKIHLPGELLGCPSIPLTHAAETFVALTPAIVDVIPLDALGQLFEQAPRLAFTLFVRSQQERIMLMDQLAVVGHTSAIQRISALLLHFHRRLKVLQTDNGDVLDWPLSQELVAQGAGLTAIHVNRTFKELTRRGLIAREGKKIRLLDLVRLSELAGLPERKFVSEPEWLLSVNEAGSEFTNLRQ